MSDHLQEKQLDQKRGVNKPTKKKKKHKKKS